MIPIEDQITFITTEKNASLELSGMEENPFYYLNDVEMYSAILDSLKLIQSNDLVLQRNCMHCEKSFSTTNSKQQFCSTNCRVAYFRAKNRLKDFTAKVKGILSEKECNPKFAVGVLIVPANECPFEVDYKGMTYKGKNTRKILTKLRNL